MLYERDPRDTTPFDQYLAFFTSRVAKTSAASIRSLHGLLQSSNVLLGLPTLSPREAILLGRHLRVLERENAREVRRAKPLRLQDIRRIEAHVNPRSEIDLLFLLAIRGAYENGVRLGNLLKHAYIDGITWLHDGSVKLVLDMTKTSSGTSVSLIYHDTGCPLCFCRLLLRHIRTHRLLELKGDYYIFPSVCMRVRPRNNTIQLDFSRYLRSKWVANKLTVLHKNGTLEEHFTGHSMRPGFATDLFASGSSLEMAKLLGRWASDTVLIYIRDEYVRSTKRSIEVQRIFDLERAAILRSTTKIQEGEGELVHAKANNQHKQDLGLNC